jgi:orotidine-5'-phosphate decarboxylase
MEHGCVGVVASGQETAMLRQHLDESLLIVTPGIRPVINDDDQKRTVTASRALHEGADYIVVGRPIRDAVDPRAAAESLQIEIAAALAR